MKALTRRPRTYRASADHARAASRDGQALVEFALVIPMFLSLVLAVFTLGRVVFAWNGLGNAAYEGVRTAIVNQTESVIDQRVIVQAASLGITPVEVTVAYTDAEARGLVCTGGTSVALGCLATVTTSHDLPIPLFGTFTVTGTASAPVERTCPDPDRSPALPATGCLR
jgi:Flp pilus assembly protein TadG